MNLDSTAGNRSMWKKRNPSDLIFMDKEKKLFVKPDVLCVWQHLPFRDNVFNVVYFDPPHDKFSETSVHNNPSGWHNPRYEGNRKIGGTFWGSMPENYVGVYSKAVLEFYRVSNRLCFKWNNSRIDFKDILRIFNRSGWVMVYEKTHKSRKRHSKTQTKFFTFTK